MFWAVAAEGFTHALLIDGGVHCSSDSLRQWLGNVTNTTADELGGFVGIGICPGRDTAADFWKQIAGFKFKEVFVDVHNGR